MKKVREVWDLPHLDLRGREHDSGCEVFRLQDLRLPHLTFPSATNKHINNLCTDLKDGFVVNYLVSIVLKIRELG